MPRSPWNPGPQKTHLIIDGRPPEFSFEGWGDPVYCGSSGPLATSLGDYQVTCLRCIKIAQAKGLDLTVRPHVDQ